MVLRLTLFTVLVVSAQPQQEEGEFPALIQLSAAPASTGWLDTDLIKNDGNPLESIPAPSPPPEGQFLDADFLRNDGNPLEALYGAPGSPAPANASAPAATKSSGKGASSAAQIGVTRRSMRALSSQAGVAAPAKEAANASKSVPAKEEEAKSGNNSAPAEQSSNVSATTAAPTVNESATAPKAATCLTVTDTRVSSWFVETAPEGTPCIFGVDVRDEGSHCIYDDGQFGSNGFCFTREDGSQWGSCNSECPLYGPAGVLGKKIDGIAKVVNRVEKAVNASAKKNAKASAASLTQVHGRVQSLRHLSVVSDIQAASQQPLGTNDGNTSAIAMGKGKSSGVVVVPLQSQLHGDEGNAAGPAREA